MYRFIFISEADFILFFAWSVSLTGDRNVLTISSNSSAK